MTSFFHTKNRSFFVRFSVPNSSPLRRTVLQSSRRDITNRTARLTVSSAGIAFLIYQPLVVTISRPQATMSNTENSVTSLNSQGRDVTF
jgi:hypothetical protein